MGMAVVYEWDHASKSLLYKNAMTKAPWRYDKNVFNLYKSAEVHTKQKRKIPGLVWFVAAGLAAAAYLVPSLQSRLVDRVNGKPLEVSKLAEPGQAKSGEKVTYVKDGIEYTVEKTVFPASGAASSPVSSAPAAPPAPVFAGCVASRNKCTCYDQSAIPVQVDPGVCSGLVASSSVVPKDQIQSFLSRVDELDSVTRLVSQGAADSSVLSFMASR
jgi:zona occludens toxin